MAVTSFAPAAAGLQPYEEIITSSKTWVKPEGVKTIELTLVGGGAAGQESVIGGGGGGYLKKIIDVSTATSAAVTIGAGGTYSATATAVGGGTSSFVPNTGNGLYVLGGGNSVYDKTGSQGSQYDPTQFGPLGLDSGNQYYGVTGSSYTNTAALIGYGNGKWVMLPFANRGENYATTQCYYSTNGTTWSAGTNLATARVFSDVAYGNGVFVAIRPNVGASATTVLTSSDGINWTETSVTMSGDKIIFANGIFVTTGYGNDGKGGSWWSTNGTTWNAGTVTRNITASETSHWATRPMWDGVKFTQVHNNGSYWTHVYQSTDGKSWTQVNNTGANGNFLSTMYQDCFYANGVYLVAFAGVSSNLWRSTTGTSWAQVNLPAGAFIKKFAYAGGIFFAVGWDYNSNYNRLFYSVDNGSTWSTLSMKDSAGNPGVINTSIGYFGSIATDGGSTVILASDSKEGGSGGSNGGVWKIAGTKLIKKGRIGWDNGNHAGAGEGSMGDYTLGTYAPYARGGLGSPEGFSAGGPGTNVASGPNNYGGGGTSMTIASGATPAMKNGFQGVAVVRWWA